MTASDEPSPRLERVRSSAFLELIGPFYVDRSAAEPTFRAQVDEQHLNTFGGAHGGFVAALIDVAAGRGIRMVLQDGRAFRTVSMTIDYIAPAALRDWVAVTATLDHSGRRTAFVTCRVTAGEVLIARGAVILNADRSASAMDRPA